MEMGLEQRVQVVEKELELLKAQIQTTLLSIQEHLLNSQYPALRAQETTSARVAPQPAPGESRPVPTNPAVKRVSAVTLTPERESQIEFDPDVDEVFSRIPPARNVVRLDEDVRFTPAPEPVIDQREREREAQQEAIDRTWMELDNWVSGKVREIGLERTRELIQLYGGKERELLLRVVDVYEEGARRSSSRNFSPFNEPPHSRQSPNQPIHSVAEQWQRHANASKSRSSSGSSSGNGRPLGDQQEMVLRLIADLLNSRDESAAAGNGYMKR
jgi:hypothetical protein